MQTAVKREPTPPLHNTAVADLPSEEGDPAATTTSIFVARVIEHAYKSTCTRTCAVTFPISVKGCLLERDQPEWLMLC